MQNHKRKILAGNTLAMLLIVLLAVGVLVDAKEARLVGTVKAIGTDSITIETVAHETKVVKMTSSTKYLKHKKPSSLSELKTGDHIEILATVSKNTAPTDTATADAQSASDTTKDSLSLGLSFTAVQASY